MTNRTKESKLGKMVLLTRREFIKKALFGASALALGQGFHLKGTSDLLDTQPFPAGQNLGRICAGGEGARFDLLARPDLNSSKVGEVYRDEVVQWLREVVASNLDRNRINQRWVETPNGFIYAPYVQPVKNFPNKALETFPAYRKDNSVWVEVTVPFVDFVVDGKPTSPWLKATLRPRLYYSQIMWADQIRRDDQGQVWYRVSEKFGSYGDIFWAPAEAFRMITPEDLSPIHPETGNKKVVVRIDYQTLSCYEGKEEVYFCRVSTGWGGATPMGSIPTWRKMISTHMSGGTSGAGYDTPGIGWTNLFSSDGAAIHSTFWHNDFGLARTHGCVNALPEDANWIFRWTSPPVAYDPGDIVIHGMNSSTRIDIIDA